MNALSPRGAIERAFTENLGLKAAALLLSLGFFGYVHGQQGQQERTLPVSVISLPPPEGDRVLTTPLPPNVHVTLRGPSRLMSRLAQEGAPPVEIDLRDGKRSQISFHRGMFQIPEELELLVVDPPRLELRWEDVVIRQIPLQASLTGKPADGHVIRNEPTIDPPAITVKGAESKVETIQYARLVPYDVTGLSEGRFPRQLALDAPPPLVRFLGSQAATVTVEVVRRRSEKTFSRRPVEVIGPHHASVVPKTVDVTIMGPPEVVRALRDDQIVPQADLTASGLWSKADTHGAVTVPVVVRIAGATAETQPPVVTVKW